jgi:carboxymethylenebutenolidase
MLPLLAAALLAQAHVHGSDAGAESGKDASVPMSQLPHALDPDAPKPEGTMTKLQAGGQPSEAYVARPQGKPRGALLVVHEWWGLNDWVKHQADQLAKEGYLALAVDLYKGKVATTPGEAAELMKAKDEAWGDQVEEAGLEWLKTNASGAKVGTIGWCMGGGESLKASLNDPKDVSFTIMYYGMPITDVARLKTLRGPVLGIWAKRDRSITPEKVAAFDKALTEAGVKHEFHSYDADHAFANPSGGRYNPEAAKDAWDKTLKFLDATVRSK